jgi:hypothetical protein
MPDSHSFPAKELHRTNPAPVAASVCQKALDAELLHAPVDPFDVWF